MSDTTESLTVVQADKTQVEAMLASLKEEEAKVKRKEANGHTHLRQKQNYQFTQQQAASVIQKSWKHHISAVSIMQWML